MKQYVPLKLVKRVKVWAVADAANGYMYDFNIYTSATEERETGLGEVVLTLANFIKRNHQLYFKKSAIIIKLLTQGMYACGTIRTSRKHYPSEINTEAQRFKHDESTFC